MNVAQVFFYESDTWMLSIKSHCLPKRIGDTPLNFDEQIPKMMSFVMYLLSNMAILGIYVKFQGSKLINPIPSGVDFCLSI